jgi:hypothetical protein
MSIIPLHDTIDQEGERYEVTENRPVGNIGYKLIRLWNRTAVTGALY